ncbi:MAG TPA: DUF488 domain-containing protein [Candidatus Limnocylindrales bacterium]|nr:DUF488 domain-containing protein [Candidatus Limnocylindrales bacterium]
MLTIGHSNRALAELIAMLRAHGVEALVDIRTVPRSRYNPQFNTDALPAPLAEAGIEYIHLPALGGLRHARKDSTNTAWKNLSFRGYADYMQTPEFDAGIDQLLAIDARKKAAAMCAEAVPWRCHRSLVADALTARGVPVWHIMSAEKKNPHKLTSFARVEDGRVTYPGENLELWQ